MTTEHFNPVPLDTKADSPAPCSARDSRRHGMGWKRNTPRSTHCSRPASKPASRKKKSPPAWARPKAPCHGSKPTLRTDKHSPSFATLSKYAHACGKRLIIGDGLNAPY